MDSPVDGFVARPMATRVDEKVTIAKELIETTEKLKRIKDVMNDMLTGVQNDRSSHGRTQKVQIRLSLEAIDQITPTVASNADAIAPVRNLKYACSREARKEKLKAKMLQDISNSVGRGARTNKLESLALQKLEKVVSQDRKLNPIRLLSKKKRQSNGHSKISYPDLPAPENVGMYTPLEAHSILSNMKGKARSEAIKKMISGRMIPVCKSQVYNMLKKPSDEIKMWWGDFGRNHILDDKAIDSHLQNLEENVGMMDTPDTVRDLLVGAKKAKLAKAGRVAVGVNVSEKTVMRTVAMLAMDRRTTISQSVLLKTNRRHIADHSLNNAVTYLVVAATHFIIGRECPLSIKDKMSKGAIMLLNLVSKANGGVPVCPIPPHYILSTDDTVEYVYEGKGTHTWSQKPVYLSSQKSLYEKKSRSRYLTVESNPQMHGQRMKLMYTMVAAGLQAPLFITITGLSNDELSPTMYPDGILVVEVEGLSIAGATNPGDKTIGYICFLRSSNGELPTDQLRHCYYRKHVYFKLLQEIRLRFDNILPSCDIPNECSSVGWMDGDWPQIKAVTSEEIMQLSETHRHTDCKHAVAASLVQQPCDVGTIFKAQHALQARTTEKDKCSILAKNISKLLASHPGLHLSDPKRRALADGISCQPKNHQRVCTPDNTRSSFIGPGLLDEGSKSAPDMLVILRTRRKTLLQEELDLVTENFVNLHNLMIQDGHIPDDKLSEMGFPTDLDMNGNEVERNAEISQEPYQRAKILSHAAQRRLREKRLRDLQEEKISKINIENHKHQKILDINKECERKLFRALGQECTSGSEQLTERTLMDATLHDFAMHCKANELTAFCRVRIHANESNSLIPKKKGKIEDAVNGEENLIVVSHRLRNRQPILQLAEPPPIFPHILAQEPVVCRFSLPSENRDPAVYELSFLTKEWIAAALRTVFFTPQRINAQQFSSEIKDIKKSTSILLVHLQRRMEKHLHDRLDSQKSKLDHWVWNWVTKNLPRLAALMVFVGHVLPDDVLSCSATNDCLLQYLHFIFAPCCCMIPVFFRILHTIFVAHDLKASSTKQISCDRNHKKLWNSERRLCHTAWCESLKMHGTVAVEPPSKRTS